MKNPGIALVAAMLALVLSASVVQAQGLDFLQKIGSDIDINGLNQDWDPETEVATVTGDVRIEYDGVVIKAKRAEYHTRTGEIKATDDVAVFQEGSLFRGDSVIYNTKTGTLTSDGLRSRAGDLVFRTENFRMESKDVDVITGENATFTTHDHVSPNYRIESKELNIYPGDRIVFKGPKLYAVNTPVFWLPKLTQPLDDELGYFFVPGYNSRWGAFLVNRYGIMHGDHTLGQYHVDLRSGRGLGVGADLQSEKFRDNPNIGHLKLYHTYDIDTEFDRESAERAAMSENRYRINFQHRIYFPGPEESTLYLDFDINKISDRLYYQDFFFSDAIFDPRPDNFINLVKTDDRYELSLLARFQLNDFITKDTRLPEIAVDFTTQQIGDMPLFYRGSSSWGILGQELSDRDKDLSGREQVTLRDGIAEARAGGPTAVPIPVLEDRINRLQGYIDGSGYHRLYSYHEVLFPTQLGPVQFIPRVGGGILRYTEIDNGTDADSWNRPIVHVGFDLSTKWTKEFEDVQSRKLGLDGLRHIVQPYLNYSYVETDEDDKGLIDPRIDGNITTTKLRPIDVPLFSNIDAIDPWNIVRLGIRHTLQTRRSNRTHTWLMFDTYMDSYIEDPEFDRDISGIHNNIRWTPLPWMRLAVDSQFPIDDNPQNFSELNTSLTWMPHERFNLGFRHLMLQDHPTFQDSSLFSLASYMRMSENWGFSTSHRFEAEEGELESQSYNLHRDLTTWTASVGVVHLINEGVDDELGVVLTFTLKDFPSVTLPVDLNPNPTAAR